MTMSRYGNERLEHLMIDQATEGLDQQQERELADLMTQQADAADNIYMETAALVQLGMLTLDSGAPQAQMSPELKARILAAAGSKSGPAPVADLAAHRERRQTERPAPASRFGLRDAGWAVAAALAVALVLVQGGASEPPELNPTQTLAAAVDASTDRVALPWSGPRQAGYESVRGEMVWSDSAQSGYMRLAGMPVNDPTRAQYQLWIVDPERSAQPVDGGVFDIQASTGEIIIPVTAKLEVDQPTLFAITLEQPGGVVVSAGPLLVQTGSTI